LASGYKRVDFGLNTTCALITEKGAKLLSRLLEFFQMPIQEVLRNLMRKSSEQSARSAMSLTLSSFFEIAELQLQS